MDSHTPNPKVTRLELIETGARRRWTLAEKLRIIAESQAGARRASATAQRYGLSTSQLFYWRKLAREGRLGGAEGGFAPATIVPAPASETPITAPWTPRRAPGAMKIVVEGGCVVVDASVDASALARVLAALKRVGPGS